MQENWNQLFYNELNTAISARQMGKEGMARVCARRAANIAIKEYLIQHRLKTSTNVIQNLKFLQTLFSIDHPLQLIIGHLLLKVTPDFNLPDGVDLIEDTITLRKILFPE